MTLLRVLPGLISFICIFATAAGAQNRPVPNGRLQSGKLSFDGHATAGDFTGITTTVSGELGGASNLPGVRGWVEAPVKTLKTGNGKRDKDLNKSMESDKYPVLRFDLAGITPSGGNADSVAAKLHGELKIHGVTRSVELPSIIRFAGSQASVRTDFPLNLKDYRIGGLSKLFGMLKMYENIEVHVDLVFQLGQPTPHSGRAGPDPMPASGPPSERRSRLPSARPI